jgi:predicted transposase/invertase (TIGR01784 family)
MSMPRRRTLDPKLDIVFKLLFTEPRNRDLLVRFLQDFLRPASPIVDVQVLNPELRKVRPRERGAEVDLLVEFDGGRRVHVEIQVAAREGFVGRSLFYWARAFSQQLSRGESFASLAPTTGIFILDYKQLQDPNWYHVFELAERSRGGALTDLLSLHYLELPKIPHDLSTARAGRAVLNWAAFLAADSDAELERLAMSDPTMHDAVAALERLSEDPYAQEAAYLREIEAGDYEARLRMRHEQGMEQGIERGLEQGIERGKRQATIAAIGHLCSAFGIALTETRERFLETATPQALDELFRTLASDRAWPNPEG